MSAASDAGTAGGSGPLDPVGATVAVVVACVGFALAGPTGLVAAVVVGAAVALPWPLAFAVGQVGAAVVFGDPATASPVVPFLVVQAALWLALARSTGAGRRDARALLVGAGTALVLVVLASGVVPGVGSAAAAVLVAVVIAGVLYAVHRYERVAAGLVEA